MGIEAFISACGEFTDLLSQFIFFQVMIQKILTCQMDQNRTPVLSFAVFQPNFQVHEFTGIVIWEASAGHVIQDRLLLQDGCLHCRQRKRC